MAVASCISCGHEQLADPKTYHPRCLRCGQRLFTLVPVSAVEARVLAAAN
jgi:DNA-directed RNA polymerase subunit RPC12/RpoP